MGSDYGIVMESGAIDTESGRYVLPSKAEKGRSYRCADCSGAVILRKGVVRRHHFAHKTVSTCQYFEHPNESQQHKDAKLRLAERLRDKLPITIFSICPKCGCSPGGLCDSDHTYEEGDEIIIEYRDPSRKYVADIAVLNAGKVRVIYEIKHTHQTTTDVRPEPWYEITTEDIFETEKEIVEDPTKKYMICCTRMHKLRWCMNCKTKTESWMQQVPHLKKRCGQETMWKQEKPCIICGCEKYSPEWMNGPLQLCKFCITTDYQTLKEMFDKPLFLDD